MHAFLLLHCDDEFSRPAHASMHSRCSLWVKLYLPRRQNCIEKKDEEMHVALLLHCDDEFSRPAHASMHSRCKCPVEQRFDEEKHAALKDVQNTIRTASTNRTASSLPRSSRQ